MSILCTRNINTDELPLLEAMQMHYDIIPFIEMECTADLQIKEHVQALASTKTIAIFTSPAAVYAVQSLLTTIPSNWQIICTAPKTRKLIADWLGANKIIHAGIDANAIVPYFATLSQNSRIIVFRGDKSLPAIPNALHLQGFDFETIEVYRNTAQPQSLQQEYEYYLFFSPSAVASFLTYNSIPDSKVAIAIGNTTKKYLEDKNIRNILASSTPELAAMLQLIKEYELKK